MIYSGIVKYLFNDDQKAIVEQYTYTVLTGATAIDKFAVINANFSGVHVGDAVIYAYSDPSFSNDGRDVTYPYLP
jgi:hypothetical protein